MDFQNQPLLKITDITKAYNGLQAVDGVSLSIGRGSCFGLLGPNGAGKTTLIEIMEDIIPPTSGTIFYKGRPRKADFKQEVGIMFQQTALLSFLTVADTLKIFSRFYDHTEPMDRLIRLCHLDDVTTQLNDRISGGQKQRLLLALALLNRPKLVFLDEPSTGLDPQARRNLWRIIDTVKSQGRTIVLTTHYMEEAENLCDDIAIMDKGQIIARGAPAALIQHHCKRATVTLPKTEMVGGFNDFKAAIRHRSDLLEFRTADVNGLIGQLLDRGVDMGTVNIRTPTLEDVFLKLTGRSLRE